ncbi:MAG: PHP domain-containing protein [Chloroflexi bacterium]|nr:PHP domain-containing protein [Chloroflexota bacterium]
MLQPEWSPVDLHLHTTASDGVLSPSELVALAVERGLVAIALTDHDSTGGIGEAIDAARGSGLEVIPSVEINTDVPAGEAHILGYYLDHADPFLQATLAHRRADRVARGYAIVEKLRGLGIDINWDRVQEIAGAEEGGAVGRPHVARALEEAGYVASVQEAFEKFIGRDGPAYVPYRKFAPEEAVALIRRAGGVPVLAHPTSLPDWEVRLPSLIEAGLLGLECYYGTYTPEVVQPLVDQAAAAGLVATGGSDFHGGEPTAWSTTVGGTPVPLEVLDELKAAAARAKQPSDAAPSP